MRSSETLMSSGGRFQVSPTCMECVKQASKHDDRMKDLSLFVDNKREYNELSK